jgi:hypothetical protein
MSELRGADTAASLSGATRQERCASEHEPPVRCLRIAVGAMQPRRIAGTPGGTRTAELPV